MNTMLRNWGLALVVCGVVSALGVALEGPTDAELDQVSAADLLAAHHAEQVALARLEKCRSLRGPRAEVILAGTGGQDFVCKVGD